MPVLLEAKHPDFPADLAAKRKAAKLTPRQLAARADISSTMVYRWENPHHNSHVRPSERSWQRINRVLEEILGATAQDDSAPSPGQQKPAAALLPFHELLRQLMAHGHAVTITINAREA